MRTCFTRVRSAWTTYGRPVGGKATVTARFCACGSIMAAHSRITSASDVGSSESDSRPDSISARSRISLIRSSRYQPARRIWSMLRFCEGVGGGVAGFDELREAEDRAQRRAQFVAHAREELGFREVRLLGRGRGALQLLLGELARRVVGADQEVADDGADVVAQRRDRHDGREAAAVLADVGELVDVLDAARGLEDQRLEARRDGGGELQAQGLRARPHFPRVVDVAGVDPVHDLGGEVAQHALGADVEDLDDALLVGGDDREVGAREDGALQGARLEERLLAADFGDALGPAGCVGHGGGELPCRAWTAFG